ncbi:MAG: hypothetical protein FWF30_03685, partial [Coriobacteriia bacterium]|nr:hypothetical protein [Coriobacteriia bacterium]
MTIELILVVLGIVFFVVALAVIILIRNRSSKKTRDLVVRPSFERQLSSRDKGLDLSLSGGEEENSKVLKKRGRLFIFAAIVAAFFGALFVRLWSLQLLNSQKYEQMALDQSLTEIPVAATRGRILDRNGVELVGNSPALSVSAPKSLADDINTVQRLSLVLGVPQRALRLKLLDQRASAQANRVLATGISISQAAYIQTRPQLFPSVEVDEGNYRSYPYGSLAAHLLGYISPVTQDDLNNDSSQGFYASGDEIGRTGAETAFEDSLRGTKGSQS